MRILQTIISTIAHARTLHAVPSEQQTAAGKLVLYASVGPELSWYDVDVDNATLSRRGSVRLPANVQYAWPHASRRYLYVTSSDSASGTGGFVGKTHHASAFRIDPVSGALSPHGNAVPLPARAVHNTTDAKSEHLLTAYNNPSGLTVHRINADGTLGDEVKQPQPLDTGIFAHQVRVTPDNRLAIIVTRGNDATDHKPEDPGALKVYRFSNGLLTDGVTVAPNGGFGFGARHLDFHPSEPWIYVSNERRSKLEVFRREGDSVSPAPSYVKELLAQPGNVRPRQLGGTVHVHPGGHVVYGINRSDHRVNVDGKQVFGGGENTLAVFAIDRSTGEPTPIQHIDTQGFHPRTFHIDPSGRMLVAAHIAPMQVREGGDVATVPATMSVFRIARDGKLSYVRKYDVDVGNACLWWMGMVAIS
jgi:6-phosphogluconolactonase (cycloisomerase 2 family)